MNISELVGALISCQQSDGGWCYTGTVSCTEPTAWAVLALRGADSQSAAVQGAEAWMKRRQRTDGGWAPRPEVETSTWVTSLGLLVFPDNKGAFDWLMSQTGRDSRFVHRLRAWMLGVPQSEDSIEQAWSWFPETAAWVAPTAYAVLALRKSGRAEARERIASGQRFLRIRQCQDGGWNHGGARALGYEASSYPETTGLALAALAGTADLQAAQLLAARQLQECRTAEGVAWLRLGLAASGWRGPAAEFPRCRGAQDLALCLLSELALDGRLPLTAAALSGRSARA